MQSHEISWDFYTQLSVCVVNIALFRNIDPACMIIVGFVLGYDLVAQSMFTYDVAQGFTSWQISCIFNSPNLSTTVEQELSLVTSHVFQVDDK